MQLSGSTILVTGATGGIGTHLCRQLAGKGATLVMNCVSTEKLDELRSELGGQHATVGADVSSSEGRQAILVACNKAGGIDALVNLAGILDFRLYTEQSEETILRILQVNTVGPMLLCRLLLPQLLAKPAARILNVGSIFASIGHPGFVAYCASKAALKTFSEALSRELAASRVSVAYIAPRATATALNSDRVNALNVELGNSCDTPVEVAAQVLSMLQGTGRIRYLGWPEKFFVRVNALLPAVVHGALVKKLPLINKHAQA